MDYWAITAGGFAILSVAISSYEIFRHLRNFTKPYLQRYIIRILLMVPIYSLNAFIAMVLPSTGLYLDSIREVYESFVIYSFMKYLLNFLKYDTNLQQYISHKPGPGHIFPFCLLPRCSGGTQFLIRCKHGILQYVVVRPLTTLIAFTSELLGFYGEGNYNPLSGSVYPVLLLVNNASQVLAMYCLVIFYSGYQHELRPMRPLAKFFSIKLVVFFSFFQSVVISGLLEIELVEQTMRQLFPNLDGKVALGRKVQEFLICFDMLIAAVGHLFAFPHKPFEEPDYSRSARLADDDQLERSYHQEVGGGAGGGGGGSDDQRPTRWRYNARESVYHDGDQDDGDTAGRSCCGAFCSILDFSEDKSDISEHFSEIFAKLRQAFAFRPALPAIVSSQVAGGGSNYERTPRGSTAAEQQQQQQQQQRPPAEVHETSPASSSGLGGSARTTPDANEGEGEGAGGGHESDGSPPPGQSINSTVKNYQSIP